MSERRTIQRFRVLEQIGAGGMGTVYRAHDPQLERDVAIKVLTAAAEPARAELSTTNTVDLRGPDGGKPSSEDLLREARMMARLSHPNVVPVYEVGLDGAAVFVVMEHVDGADLRSWLAAGPRAVDEILAVFAQAGDGLAAAHARGIVHRDFKPDNVLIGADGRVRVADFGLSRLVTSASMVRVADMGGTPRYMSPELWGGAAATTASDVFAFSTALVEALGANPKADADELVGKLREVAPGLAALLVAGLDETASKRPAIGQLVAGLRSKPRRTAIALGVGGLGIAAIGIGVVIAFGTADSPEACADDPALLDRRWDPTARTMLRSGLTAGNDYGQVELLLQAIDKRAGEIATLHRATCEAAQRAELTDVQAAKRASCLERRALELGMRARYYASKGGATDVVHEHLLGTVHPSTCEYVDTPVIHRDRARIEVLYRRFVGFRDKPIDADAITEIAAIETAAAALDESELEVSAAITLTHRLRNADRHDEARKVQERAHRRAQEIKSPDLTASAMILRTQMAIATGDAAAKSLAELALDQADKPAVSQRVRTEALQVLAHAQLLRGEYREAIDTARRGLALIAEHGRHAEAEVILRQIIINALQLVTGRHDEALAFAKESVEVTRVLVGESSNHYATMLDLLARSYNFSRQPEKALEPRREALALLRTQHPETHSRVVMARVAVAEQLTAAGQLDAAYAEMVDTAKLAADNPALKPQYPWVLDRLATATWDVGRHAEGVRLFEDAVERMTSLHGSDHPTTLGVREALVDVLIEVGRHDEAERAIAAMFAAFARVKQPGDKRPAFLRGGPAATLALARGRSDDAEKLARASLAEQVELKATEYEKRIASANLAEALFHQRRFPAAHELMLSVLEVGKAHNQREDHIASYELLLARIERALGKYDDATARAERVRDTLARWPTQPKARAAVAAFLDEKPK